MKKTKVQKNDASDRAAGKLRVARELVKRVDQTPKAPGGRVAADSLKLGELVGYAAVYVDAIGKPDTISICCEAKTREQLRLLRRGRPCVCGRNPVTYEVVELRRPPR